MLLSTNHLSGFKIKANDGDIGKLHNFLLDDRSWIVRYIVVDTGSWLQERKVLVVPSAAGKPDGETAHMPVSLTRKQVEESPDIDTDKTVSRVHEKKLHLHYQWEPYWIGGTTPLGPVYIPPPDEMGAESENFSSEEAEDKSDPHLRSAEEITGYKIHASNGEIGHVKDFIVDTEGWVIRYIIVDTQNWLPGKKVIISPEWIRDISWTDSAVTVAMTKEDIEKSPEYDPSLPINMEYEARLYDYYGKPKYWE